MKNYVEYNGVCLKITAARVLEIEDKLDAGLIEKMNGAADQLRVLSTIIAGAIPNGEWEERHNKALSFYEKMLAENKNITDYQMLVFELLVAAGFMSGEELKLKTALLKIQKQNLAASVKNLGELQTPSQS